MRLVDGSEVLLNPQNDPLLAAHLAQPRAVVWEMIRQLNKADYYAGLFERKNLRFLDIGANLGLVSLYASPHCLEVAAVEAEPETYKMMLRLIGQHSRLRGYNLALAPKRGDYLIGVSRSDLSCHTITNAPATGVKRHTLGVPFNELMERVGFQWDWADVCKVDIEGMEMATLTEEVLSNAPVKVWYIEVHKTPDRTRNQNVYEMVARLNNAGYTCKQPRVNAIIATHVGSDGR